MAVKKIRDIPPENYRQIIEDNYEFFNDFEQWNFDDAWEFGLEGIEEFCKEKSDDGITFEIARDKIQWSSSSQGPYFERYGQSFVFANICKNYGDDLDADVSYAVGRNFDGDINNCDDISGTWNVAGENEQTYDLDEANWQTSSRKAFERDEEYVLQTMKEIHDKVWDLIQTADRNEIEDEAYIDYLESNRFGYDDEEGGLHYIPTDEEHDREVGQDRLQFEESIQNYLIHKEKKLEERINNNSGFPYPEVNKQFLDGEVQDVNNIQKNGAEAPKADSMREGKFPGAGSKHGPLAKQEPDSVATEDVSNIGTKLLKEYFGRVDWEGAKAKLLSDPKTFRDSRMKESTALNERKRKDKDRSAPYQIYVGKDCGSKYGEVHETFETAKKEADKLFDKLGEDVSVIIKSISRKAIVYNILGNDIDPELYGPAGTRVSSNLDAKIPIQEAKKPKEINKMKESTRLNESDKWIWEDWKRLRNDGCADKQARRMITLKILGYYDERTKKYDWGGMDDPEFDNEYEMVRDIIDSYDPDESWCGDLDEATIKGTVKLDSGQQLDIESGFKTIQKTGGAIVAAKLAESRLKEVSLAGSFYLLKDGNKVGSGLPFAGNDPNAMMQSLKAVASGRGYSIVCASTAGGKQLMDSTKNIFKNILREDFDDDDDFVSDEEMDNYQFDDFDDPNRDGRIEQAIRYRDAEGMEEEDFEDWDDDLDDDYEDDMDESECVNCGAMIPYDADECPECGDLVDNPETWDEDQTDWDDDDWDAHESEVAEMTDPHSMSFDDVDHEFDAVENDDNDPFDGWDIDDEE